MYKRCYIALVLLLRIVRRPMDMYVLLENTLYAITFIDVEHATTFVRS